MPNPKPAKKKPAAAAAAAPPISGRTSGEWAQLLVDNVSTSTQKPLIEEAGSGTLRHPGPYLEDVEDWRRNAVALFKLALERSYAGSLGDALLRLVELAGVASGAEWQRARETLTAAGRIPDPAGGLTRLAEERYADALDKIKTFQAPTSADPAAHARAFAEMRAIARGALDACRRRS